MEIIKEISVKISPNELNELIIGHLKSKGINTKTIEFKFTINEASGDWYDRKPSSCKINEVICKGDELIDKSDKSESLFKDTPFIDAHICHDGKICDNYSSWLCSREPSHHSFSFWSTKEEIEKLKNLFDITPKKIKT